MKSALLVLVVALGALIPFRVKAAQTSQRAPVPSAADERFRLGGGGVPSGYMILGDTEVSPPGYSYSGISLNAPSWSAAERMQVARADLAAATVDGRIYVIGGSNGEYLSSVEEYAPESDTWSFRAPMPTARTQIAAAVVEQQVYVFGGYNENVPAAYLPTVEVYDPATDTWSVRAQMASRRSVTTAVVDGKVLVMGGYNGQPLSLVEEYDPASDTWTPRPPMPMACTDGAAAVLNGIVYVVGGSDSSTPTSTIMVYDPAMETWSTRPGPAVHRHAVATLDGVLYSLGGLHGGTYAFDSQVTAWDVLEAMPTPRVGLAAAVVSDQIYLLGGAYGRPSSTVERLGAPQRLYAHRKN